LNRARANFLWWASEMNKKFGAAGKRGFRISVAQQGKTDSQRNSPAERKTGTRPIGSRHY